MAKPLALNLDVVEQGTVHLLVATSRPNGKLQVTTGCGQDLLLAAPKGALVDIGVSIWQSDITCEACQARGKKD